MLSVEGLSVSYGGLRALTDVTIRVDEGRYVAIVGPNGAGKTTLFKAISGTVLPTDGRITWEGEDLLKISASERAHRGIAHVPEGRQMFKSLTVYENLEIGAQTQRGRVEWSSNLDQIFSLFPVLKERRNQFAGTLSGGEQQMLAIGRGLASSPRLLMLDEPSMGLAPKIADMIFERIEGIHKDRKLAILLVEQRVAEALSSCDRGYVLDTGRLVIEGTAQSLLNDDRVKRVYLGM